MKRVIDEKALKALYPPMDAAFEAQMRQNLRSLPAEPERRGARRKPAAALIAAIGFGLESLYVFLSTLEWREKDKESVSYNIMWGTAALTLLMLGPAVMTVKLALGL